MSYWRLFCRFSLLLACCAAMLGQAAQFPFANSGASLVHESVSNNIIEPNEQITVRLGIKNIGLWKATNLVATIETGNGVLNPSPATLSYGPLNPMGPSAAQDFSFTVDAPNNALLAVTLHLQADGVDAGTVTYKFRVGPIVTTWANPTQIFIRDFTNALPYPSGISVSNLLGTVTKVEVTFSNLFHSFPADMDILLVSPSGDAVMLMSDACGDSAILGQNVTFSSDATNVLPQGGGILFTNVLPANYTPLEDYLPPPAPLFPFASALSAFNGRNPNGIWSLFIVDDEPGDDGRIEGGWVLKLTTGSPANLPPPALIAGKITDDGKFHFEVRGTAFQRYTIEAAPELLLFEPLHTFVMPPNGRYAFDLPAQDPYRFFRAASEP